MFQGFGNDGAGVALAEREAGLASSLLLNSDRGDDVAGDATDAAEPTLWTPAPGAVVVLPERYTPTYAYPSLIWLAGPGESEHSAREWLEGVSTRNFVGIGLRPELHSGSRDAAENPSRDHRGGLSRFDSLLRSVENWVRLHPRRRYIVGSGASARTAIAWLMSRPDWFAGAIAIDTPPSSAAAWHTTSKLAAGRRLLWLRTRENNGADIDSAELLALSCLGLDVTNHLSATTRGTPSLGQRINRWILEDVPTTIRE